MDPKTQHMQQARDMVSNTADSTDLWAKIAAILAERDALAAQAKEARALADSEGTRAVNYLRRARKAEADLRALAARVGVLTEALRFYGRGQHYVTDDAEDFDTVSGEPANWLFSGLDESSTSIEDGTIARRALRGEAIDWINGPLSPVEAASEAPAEPVAPKALMPEQAIRDIANGLNGVQPMLGQWERDLRLARSVEAKAYAAGMDRAVEVCESLRARESASAAHHAGRDYAGAEWHMTRHAAICEARDAIRAAKGE